MLQLFHLDAGRKFFGIPALKTLIDTMSQGGYTHFQLYLTDNQGFRLALEDMTVQTSFGSFDLTPCLGDGYCEGPKSPSGCGRFHSPQDMKQILAYARERGICVIPVINMPGHMGCILQHFPQMRYPRSNSSIDLTRPQCREFALKILEKYADFFSELGCTHMSFGADEFANDIAPGYPDEIIMGFDRLYHEGGMEHFVTFFNDAARVILDRGMIPLAFHDGVYYRNDKKYGEMDNRVMLCHWTNGWDTYVPATPDFLQAQGFPVINSPQRIYCGMGCRDWNERAENARSFDPHLFEKDVVIPDPAGAMLCFWSDRGNFDGQDDGVTAAGHLVPVLEAFAEAMKPHRG